MRYPIKTIDRYLIRSFTYSYLISVLIMMSLYVLLDMFANIDEFADPDKPMRRMIREILSYYGYHSFLYFAQVAGMITLVAAAFTLARLYRSNELTAMLAGGISLYRVALPIILMGLVFNALWVVDQECIIPRIADKLVLAHSEAGGKRAFSLGFLRDSRNALLTASRYVPAEKKMEEMLVLERDAEGQLVAKISAESATWDADRGCWALTRGMVQAPSNVEEFVVRGDVKRRPMEYYKSEWQPDDLLLRQAAGWTWLMGLGELNALLRKPHLVPDIREIVAARHVRFTQPVVNILILLLGIPFFLNREPHNVLLSVGWCLALAILCFMLAFVSQNVASTSAYPALAAWMPILVFGPVATYLITSIKT